MSSEYAQPSLWWSYKQDCQVLIKQTLTLSYIHQSSVSYVIRTTLKKMDVCVLAVLSRTKILELIIA